MIKQKLLSLAIITHLLGLFPILTQAETPDNLKYTRKTLFCTIIEPQFGQNISIEDWIENIVILENEKKNAFNIRGVAQKNSSNQLFIITHAPKLINNFEGIVEKDTEIFHFRWEPRQDIFKLDPNLIPELGDPTHYSSDIANIINAQRYSSEPTSPIPNIPADFEKIIERNETWHLNESPLIPCKEPHTETVDCKYTPGQWVIDNPGDAPRCQLGSLTTVIRNCDYSYTCEAAWWGSLDDTEQKITATEIPSYSYPDMPTTNAANIRTGSRKTIYEYILWWEETGNGPTAYQMFKNNLLAQNNTLRDNGNNLLLAQSRGPSRNFNPPPPPPGNGLPPGPITNPTPECGESPCTPPCSGPSPRPKSAIERKLIRVDDFEKYEIWYNFEDDGELPYLNNVGVQRDPRVSRKLDLSGIPDYGDQEIINRDPANKETGMRSPCFDDPDCTRVWLKVPFNQITYKDYNGDTQFFTGKERAYFALFEVQRIDIADKNNGSGAYEGPVNPTNYNNQSIPIDIQSKTNDEGYLIAAKNDIVIRNQAAEPFDSIEKVEFEMKNVRLQSNKEGEFIYPDFSLKYLNPTNNLEHSIVCLYDASDNEFVNTAVDDTFFVTSRRDASKFVTDAINNTPPFFGAQTEPYGTVYDSWTMLPVPNSTMNCVGRSEMIQGGLVNYSLTQYTDTDGYFSFFASPGVYQLWVTAIMGKNTDNFIYPSKIAAGRIDCTQNKNLPNDDPYTEVYCQNPPGKIIVEQKIEHRDMPIDPTIYGTADPLAEIFLANEAGEVIMTTKALPNGKFSFFASKNREYSIVKILYADGTEEILNLSITPPINRPLSL